MASLVHLLYYIGNNNNNGEPKCLKNIMKKLKSRKGNSLAEFAVTTAMMATLATTAAPKFVGIGGKMEKRKLLR